VETYNIVTKEYKTVLVYTDHPNKRAGAFSAAAYGKELDILFISYGGVNLVRYEIFACRLSDGINASSRAFGALTDPETILI
jgi:hypothetical protein